LPPELPLPAGPAPRPPEDADPFDLPDGPADCPAAPAEALVWSEESPGPDGPPDRSEELPGSADPDAPPDGPAEPLDPDVPLDWLEGPLAAEGPDAPLGWADDPMDPDNPLDRPDNPLDKGEALDGPDAPGVGAGSPGGPDTPVINPSEEPLVFPRVDAGRGLEDVKCASGASGPADNGPISRTRHSASPQVSACAPSAGIVAETPVVRTAIAIAREQPTAATVFIFASCTTIECPIANPPRRAWFRAGLCGRRGLLRFIGSGLCPVTAGQVRAAPNSLANRPCRAM
jgi:hypothetical protein